MPATEQELNGSGASASALDYRRVRVLCLLPLLLEQVGIVLVNGLPAGGASDEVFNFSIHSSVMTRFVARGVGKRRPKVLVFFGLL